MNQRIILLAGLIVLMVAFWWQWRSFIKEKESQTVQETLTLVREKPYEKFSFENLAKLESIPGNIEIGKLIGEDDSYSSYLFYYVSGGRKISGQINIPNLSRLMPVVIMARGYVEKDIYQTGMGTKNAAAQYAKSGYITLAPDFSGYGESDSEDTNALGARLTKPKEILDLIASIKSLPQADADSIFLWGHSNGGQIMLSVAEILGRSGKQSGVKGMTLWAPVSKPFPYSILFYTDEADDKGKWLRSEIAKFEQDYDVYNYSIDRYLDWINIPILIHQGAGDEEVPKNWSDELVVNLKDKENILDYFVYPGANHNLQPGWNEVVARDLEFFASWQR